MEIGNLHLNIASSLGLQACKLSQPLPNKELPTPSINFKFLPLIEIRRSCSEQSSRSSDVNATVVSQEANPGENSPRSLQGSNHHVNILPVVTPTPSFPRDSALNCENGIFTAKKSPPVRLNKFVRRLHEMLLSEKDSGIVEWRKGLLVLHSTDAFSKKVLPKYFNTKNFKTFRRQLNYYGFVHVRSFSATGSTTTALWVNQDLAKRGTKCISSVLMLKRVDPCESAKTAEGRRVRKEEAVNTVEDIGINSRSIHLNQIHTLQTDDDEKAQIGNLNPRAVSPPIPRVVQYQTNTVFSSPTLIPKNEQCGAQDKNRSEVTQNLKLTTTGLGTIDSSTDNAANLLLMLSRS